MKTFHVQTLADGVYAAVSIPGTGAFANAGIIDLGDATLVFDTFSTVKAAQELKQAAEELTQKKVAYVINSHEHFDHIHGNQVFPDATIISTARTREVMAQRRPAFLRTIKEHPEFLDQMQEQIDQEQDPAKRRELETNYREFRAIQDEQDILEIKLPTVTFENRLTIHGAKRSVELYCHGGGHSPSDAYLHVPDAGVVFLADLLHVGYHGAFTQGNPEQWVEILEHVQVLDADTYVPGHGMVGTRADIAAMSGYLAHLLDFAPRYTGDPKSAPIPAEYAEWGAPSIYAGNLQFLLRRR